MSDRDGKPTVRFLEEFLTAQQGRSTKFEPHDTKKMTTHVWLM